MTHETEKKSVVSEDRINGRRFLKPRVNITETSDGILLCAEMPGTAKDSIEVSVEKDVLSLSGRKKRFSSSAPVYLEAHDDCEYKREFILEQEYDGSRIKARFDSGMLMLDIPRAESAKAKKITIS